MLSGNEVERLKSLRGKLAVLCPESEGLQAKHRIKRILRGKTREERVEELMDRVAHEQLTFDSSYKDARLVSQIFIYEPFTPKEVFEILCKNRYR